MKLYAVHRVIAVLHPHDRVSLPALVNVTLPSSVPVPTGWYLPIRSVVSAWPRPCFDPM